jgi:transposase
MASVLAAIGFFILPAKRQQAKEDMRRKIADLRERLSKALREQFGQEIRRTEARLRESIAPYSQFVRAEGDRLRAIEQELRDITNALAAIRAKVERLAA